MHADDLDTLWRAAVDSREAYLSALRRLKDGTVEDYLETLRQGLGRTRDREAALAAVELLIGLHQEAFVEDLVELISLDLHEAYRCAAILRSIADQTIIERIEAKALAVLDAGADDVAYLRLGGLLKSVGSPLLSDLLARAASSPDPDVRDVVQYLQVDGPRWQI